jgi:hypothetical protein
VPKTGPGLLKALVVYALVGRLSTKLPVSGDTPIKKRSQQTHGS